MSVPRIATLFAALAATLALAAPLAGGYQDVLESPALASPLAAKSLLNGLASAGRRLVAVGQRGHIVYSDDNGRTWVQANVPVASDLVAVSFPSPRQGWAVGHDGVVLHSTDAGATWVRQLDGRSAGKLMLDFYTAQAEQGGLGAPEEAARLLGEVRRVAAQGAEHPFLDVWFADESTGFVVGAFNLVFHTRDGGRTWEPWFHRTENPNRLHLYSIRGAGSEVYATGEQGLVLKLDPVAGRLRALETPYKGTFFGALVGNDSVLVFGLRGNAFRSTDRGRSWQKADTSVQEGLTAGTVGERGPILVSQSGRVLVSEDGGTRFVPVKLDQTIPAAAVAPIGGGLAIAGPRGVRIQPLY